MKIFGGGNLWWGQCTSFWRRKDPTNGRVAIESEERDICSRCRSIRDMMDENRVEDISSARCLLRLSFGRVVSRL